MATASQIVEKASQYIGVKESPKGSNKVKFNTDYYGRAVSGSAYPWCVTFVWDIFRLCKASNLFYGGKKTASCTVVWNWAKKSKLDRKTGQKGDIVIFSFSHNNKPEHMGIVVKKNSNGTYTTIEGNTSTGDQSNGGEVMRRTRNERDIIGFVRPKYSAEKRWVVGQTYTLQGNMNVRTGAGLTYPIKKRSQLTADGKKHAKLGIKAVLKKGTKVTVQSISGNWVKIPSGWVCGKSGDKWYVR